MGFIIIAVLVISLFFFVAMSMSEAPQLPYRNYDNYNNVSKVERDTYYRKTTLRIRIKKNLSVHFKASFLNMITNTIIERHNEPWRAYHTMNHINSILDMLEDNAVIFSNKEVYAQLFLVAVYHDIVYKPWRKDNEKMSAELFKKHWAKYAMKSPNKEVLGNFVYNCIIQTKNHDGEKHLEHVFNSLDMAIISGTKEEVMLWEKEIAKEYSYVPYKTYKKYRLEFLEKFSQYGNISKVIEYVKSTNKTNNPVFYFLKNYFKLCSRKINKFFTIDMNIDIDI